MIKIYKYGFWILLLLSFTLLNLWRITKNSSQIELSKYDEINQNRIFSLIVSNIHANRKMDEVTGENVITGKKNKNF